MDGTPKTTITSAFEERRSGWIIHESPPTKTKEEGYSPFNNGWGSGVGSGTFPFPSLFSLLFFSLIIKFLWRGLDFGTLIWLDDSMRSRLNLVPWIVQNRCSERKGRWMEWSQHMDNICNTIDSGICGQIKKSKQSLERSEIFYLCILVLFCNKCTFHCWDELRTMWWVK